MWLPSRRLFAFSSSDGEEVQVPYTISELDARALRTRRSFQTSRWDYPQPVRYRDGVAILTNRGLGGQYRVAVVRGPQISRDLTTSVRPGPRAVGGTLAGRAAADGCGGAPSGSS